MRCLRPDELLAVRDGEAHGKDHVASCEACAAEVERLEKVREQLRALPQLSPRADGWPRVARAQAERRRRQRTIRLVALAAAVLLGVSSGGYFLGRLTTQREAAVAARATAQNRVVALRAESQALEARLRDLGPDPVLDARTAGAIVDLEDQLSLIDAHLARPDESPTGEEILWRARIQVLRSLIDARRPQPSLVSL